MALTACGSDDDAGRTFDFSEFEAEIEAFIGETEAVDGVGAIIVHRADGVIYHESFGTFTNDRISLIASATKSATAGVLLRLADQGLLDMDAPIVDQVAWGDDNPEITPAQLLSNSSGLLGLIEGIQTPAYVCQYMSGGTLQECSESIFNTDEDDDNTIPGRRVVPPDTEFRYGGGQWQIAGAVAEIVSGKSWSELVRETYVEPCDLDVFGYGNHFFNLAPNEFGYPEGFASDPSTLMPTDNPNMEGGMYTTTGDYGKFLLMQLRRGLCGDNRVLSEESAVRMRSDRIGPIYGAESGFLAGGYGLGWWVIADALVVDPGAYGAVPWIDDSRDYAGFLMIEASSNLGIDLFFRTIDLVADEIDRQYSPVE